MGFSRNFAECESKTASTSLISSPFGGWHVCQGSSSQPAWRSLERLQTEQLLHKDAHGKTGMARQSSQKCHCIPSWCKVCRCLLHMPAARTEDRCKATSPCPFLQVARRSDLTDPRADAEAQLCRLRSAERPGSEPHLASGPLESCLLGMQHALDLLQSSKSKLRPDSPKINRLSGRSYS